MFRLNPPHIGPAERLHKLHIMAEVIFHLVATRYSPFEQQELAPQLHTTSLKRMTAAITADYSDTGPGNAENLSELTQQDLPEEILFKGAYADTFKVQCCNNIYSFYEYENGKTNINVKGRLKTFCTFLVKKWNICFYMLSKKDLKFLYYMNQNQYF